MAITPTSTKSKQYQALGIDEIANDIETAFSAISELQDNPSTGYTETIVNISSAQILAMGTTPIQLLPAPNVNEYYDVEKIIIEFTFNNTGYTLSGGEMIMLYTNHNTNIKLPSGFIVNAGDKAVVINDVASSVDFTNEIPFIENSAIGQGFVLGTWLTTDPTDGDGTLRVKIYHKTITFGA